MSETINMVRHSIRHFRYTRGRYPQPLDEYYEIAWHVKRALLIKETIADLEEPAERADDNNTMERLPLSPVEVLTLIASLVDDLERAERDERMAFATVGINFDGIR